MTDRIGDARQVIGQMERQLRTELLKKDGRLQEEKLWENTYIKRQIERRDNHEPFSVEDHIRAMVYAMLSGNVSWDRIAGNQEIDRETKRLACVDRIFCNYDAGKLLECKPQELRDALKDIKCASLSTLKQMEALLSANIPKLLAMEQEYGTVDAYYRRFTEDDRTLKTLVTALSAQGSKDKMAQMDIALVCEYLRNAGYDLPKPDTHICRILGKDYLAFSEEQDVPPFEAYDIVRKLAELTGKPAAEVDYILWSYCAKGYGEVCTKVNPKCEICAVKAYC